MLRTPEFKVGVTVLVAAIVLIGGIMWGTGFRMRAETTSLSVSFANVYGIGVDGPVTIGGVRGGTVTGVRLKNGTVLIDLELDGKVTLPADSRILVKNDGLMGGKFIAIELGDAAEPLDLSRPVPGTVESGVTDIMGAMGGMMAKLERTVNGLDRLLGNDKLEASLMRSLTDVEKTAAALSSLVRENRGSLESAVGDLSRSSRVLGNVMDGRGEQLAGALDNLVTVSGQAKTTMARLDELTVSFKAITAKIEKKEGSLGKLVNSDELYLKMVSSIGQLDSLLADVKRNPKKYTQGIKLELF